MEGCHPIIYNKIAVYNDTQNVHNSNIQLCISDSINKITTRTDLKKYNINQLNNLIIENISDVSALGNVYDLELHYCYNITDVSALGTVYNLSLRGCKNISDVSALGKVHTLKIVDCDKITDVSALKNVHT